MHDKWMRTKQWVRLLFKQLRRPFVQAGEVCVEATLRATHFGPGGEVIKDYGIVSTRAVTDAFVEFVVDNLQTETAEFGDFKYHDSGTGGATSELASQTDLVTKVETGRATGTQAEGSSANIYQTVGTISYTATRAIDEHAVFSQSSGGTMMDRSVFTDINVDNGDSIQFTYELTLPSGG